MTSVMAVQQPAAPVQVTPAMRAKAEDNLRKAKVQLVLHQPFFASIILKRRIEIKDDVPTAYVTAAGKIVVGTEFFSTLTVQQAMGLLAHESMHYAMMHHIRVGHRKPRAANSAMDKVINDILKASGMELPPNGTFMEGAKDYAWEQLYDDTEEDGGGGKGPYQPGTGNDDLSGEGIGDVTSEQIEEIKQELIQAATAAKSRGTMPVGMDALIADIINPVTPWHQLLERFMLLQIKAGVSWRRPNKRFIGHDLYMPSAGLEPRMGTVVIQIDESGSVPDSTMPHFGGHLNKIIELCKPEKVYVLHTDSRVAFVEEFSAEDYPITFTTHARGGTDMAEGFKWVEDNGVEPDVFITLTDGETPWGEAPGYPVVWLVTGKDIVADHGETIFYELED